MTIPRPQPPPQSPTKPSIHFDWQDWLPHIEHADLSDADKRAFIETLWQIIIAFVDLGWEVENGANSSGQIADMTALISATMVDSEYQSTQHKEEEL